MLNLDGTPVDLDQLRAENDPLGQEGELQYDDSVLKLDCGDQFYMWDKTEMMSAHILDVMDDISQRKGDDTDGGE
jgi:hypothetical protein